MLRVSCLKKGLTQKRVLASVLSKEKLNSSWLREVNIIDEGITFQEVQFVLLERDLRMYSITFYRHLSKEEIYFIISSSLCLIIVLNFELFPWL